MRIAPHHGRARRRITLPMSSMIDVVFLLLAYFVVTSIVMEREDRLSPTLQVDDGGSIGDQDFEPQIVEVAKEGDVTVWRVGARTFTDRESLIEALGRLPKAPGLFVRVSSGPNVSAVAAAIQCGRDAGFTEVTYVPAED